MKDPPALKSNGGSCVEAAVISDEEVVARVRAGEIELFELLLRRYNQRVYRTARAVLRNDAEAEDVTQEAWVRAFSHLDQFEHRARFSTWLTRIALHEAWSRARRSRRFEDPPVTAAEGAEPAIPSSPSNPESETAGREIRSHVEAAVESLPEGYRVVFVLREIEELSTAETAEALDLSEDVVKTRLHRARAMLRRALLERAGPTIGTSFSFLGARCDRMTRHVMEEIRRKAVDPIERRVP
jgi:RNA polymerase sigma-70 factor (ECF subfamily)